jgi:hypothetical protein
MKGVKTMTTFAQSVGLEKRPKKKCLKLTNTELTTYENLLRKIDAATTVVEIESYHRQIRRIIETAEEREYYN